MIPSGIIFSGDEMYFKRLKDLREDSDYTQVFISEYLNMQRSVYRRYESGEREIPVWALMKLAELYRCSTDYILGLTDSRA
jgi:transcriptional regulator with XRE-family HTH domain